MLWWGDVPVSVSDDGHLFCRPVYHPFCHLCGHLYSPSSYHPYTCHHDSGLYLCPCGPYPGHGPILYRRRSAICCWALGHA
ncbi:pre-mrna-processing atp-dependent rna helicase prp5 [Moniliophthora roreri]|nr:pre-mrna-processing atp-dependent rna helicase prp5 [Moniliophthora roreri]